MRVSHFEPFLVDLVLLIELVRYKAGAIRLGIGDLVASAILKYNHSLPAGIPRYTVLG